MTIAAPTRPVAATTTYLPELRMPGVSDQVEPLAELIAPQPRPAPYADSSELTGALAEGDRVNYREVLSNREKLGLNALIALNLITGIAFIGWLLWPSHLPAVSGAALPTLILGVTAGVLMVAVELIRLMQGAALWLFATRAKDPVPLKPRAGLRVAALTTIVPNKEPLELVVKTLKAMKQMDHDGILDVWLLDEGDDPTVAEACAAIGVHHFSRKGVAEWNTATGQFKAKTKAGNHNAWRDAHEGSYDVVAQMDPDHIPTTDFLIRTIGYFNDPDVGFVVAPQVYGNLEESWIAHGAAVQAYVFHGVIQRGGNGMEAPLLIGTNHLYRPSTLGQVGGYQDSIIEDHLTSMAVFAASNPTTGNRWKGVYTPDILAVGEGPTSFTDYFNQQKRWAYGIWQIMANHSPSMFGQMRPMQRLSFSLLQMFYPSIAVSWVLGNLVTAMYFLGGMTADLPPAQWLPLWAASMVTSLASFFWLRRFNLAEHERKELGLPGMVLLLLCLPVYVAAAAGFLLRRPLAYAVTAKGDLTSPDSMATFRPHMPWAVFSVSIVAAAAVGAASPNVGLVFWLGMTALVSLAPMVVHGFDRVTSKARRGGGRRRRVSEIAGVATTR